MFRIVEKDGTVKQLMPRATQIRIEGVEPEQSPAAESKRKSKKDKQPADRE